MNFSSSQNFAVAATAVLLAVSCPLFAGQVIVDTDFSQAAPDGQLTTSARPVDLALLPLKTPTVARTNPPSTLKAGKETLGDLKPPYALIKLEQSAENPEASAGVICTSSGSRAAATSSPTRSRRLSREATAEK